MRTSYLHCFLNSDMPHISGLAYYKNIYTATIMITGSMGALFPNTTIAPYLVL